MSNTDQKPEPYMLDDNGKLFREGQHIGTLDGENMKLLPDFKNYSASVTRWLNKKAEEQEAEEKENPPEEKPKAKTKGPDADEEELKALTGEAKKDAEKSRALHKDDVEFAREKGISEPPKKNPQFGDKTPAYVEWLKKHRPEVWKQRFGVKGKGQVPVWEVDADGVEQFKGYREADMASRKTHLTEKVETNRGLSEDMDWDA